MPKASIDSPVQTPVSLSSIRILATTDIHARLTAYDYYSERPDHSAGLTLVASLIKHAKEEVQDTHTPCLLFDNGDSLAGSPMEVVGESDKQMHPTITAFRQLGYDAIGLGNHDFDLGLDVLERAIRDAPCPVLSSNLRCLDPDQSLPYQSHAFAQRSVMTADGEVPISIGVLSILPPQTMSWNSPHLKGRYEVDEILTTANRVSKKLRAQGADLIVLLAHSGLDGEVPVPGMENAVIPLGRIRDIDVIIAGHTHLRFPDPKPDAPTGVDYVSGMVHGTPTVMPGAFGSDLGVIDLDLRRNKDKCWRIARAHCALRSANATTHKTVEEDEDLKQVLAPLHDRTLQVMREPVGACESPVHSYFSFFGKDRGLQILAAAQAAAARPYLEDLVEAQGLPVISVTSPSKFGGRAGPGSYTEIAPGAIMRRHIADLNPYHNDVAAVLMSGAQLLDWLNFTARRFLPIRKNKNRQPLLNPDVAGHDFDVFFGLRYVVDLAYPSRHVRGSDGRRISGALIGNAMLKPDQDIVVVLNSYRADGGGDVPALKTARRLPLPKITVRDALTRHFADPAHVDAIADVPWPWRFAPLAGSTVNVMTGQGARKYLHELDTVQLERAEDTADGFLELTLSL